MKVLVTGANGLVGQAVCATLEQAGLTVVRAVRRAGAPGDLALGDLSGQTDWAALLPSGLDAVVHLAAQVPGGGLEDDAALQAYQKTNVEGALHLARGCSQKGVKRFVFISTAKVFGEGQDEPYSTNDPAQPEDAYAASKWAAERGLQALASETGMELVILRPPLVYGPGVKGNFLRLMRTVERGIPLPFGAVHNRRSMIGVGNLADAIRLSVIHPAAVGRTYAVSDGEDLSTPDLIREIALAMQRKNLSIADTSAMDDMGGKHARQAASGRATDRIPLP